VGGKCGGVVLPFGHSLQKVASLQGAQMERLLLGIGIKSEAGQLIVPPPLDVQERDPNESRGGGIAIQAVDEATAADAQDVL